MHGLHIGCVTFDSRKRYEVHGGYYGINTYMLKHQTDTLKYEISRCRWLYTYCHVPSYDAVYGHMTTYDVICRHMPVYPFSSR
jgi:hypothetical protein